jgi:hypothetical protein
MKVIAFDETEKFIMKGVIENVEEEERQQVIFEFIEENMKDAEPYNTGEETLMLSVLSQLHDVLLMSDQTEYLKALQGDFNSMFDNDNDKIWLPYEKSELISILGEKVYEEIFEKEQNPPTAREVGQPHVAEKRSSTRTL